MTNIHEQFPEILITPASVVRYLQSKAVLGLKFRIDANCSGTIENFFYFLKTA
jgi:hypothetical protein